MSSDNRVRIAPSRIWGTCPAGYQIDHEMVIEGTTVQAVTGPICYVALSAFTCQVSQIKCGRATNHVSCPGCGSDSSDENRVVFVLSSDETWNLSRKYSFYNWARIDGRATDVSEKHCSRCWEYTQANEYVQAEHEIDLALAALREEA